MIVMAILHRFLIAFLDLQMVGYSSVKEIVEHQQYVFEILWNKSMSAERRIFFALNETKQMGEEKQNIWM